jgi:hypothetical protein
MTAAPFSAITGVYDLEDIANVQRIRSVVSAERLLDRSALDQLLAQAKAAAQQ